jgi:hypothetical protein
MRWAAPTSVNVTVGFGGIQIRYPDTTTWYPDYQINTTGSALCGTKFRSWFVRSLSFVGAQHM